MRPAALRVGLFALVGVGLLALAVVLVGGRWFAPTERAQMRFDASVYGLQPGAPVVLRGVRVGSVVEVGLSADAAGRLQLPVTAEFDRETLRGLLGPSMDASREPLIPTLVARGLVARLASQSLLTGLLYVDLDVRPGPTGTVAPLAASAREGGRTGLPLIPTQPSTLQTFQARLEQLDLAQLGADLSAMAGAMRQLLADPNVAQVFGRTAEAAVSMRDLSRALQRDLVPLTASLRRVVDDLEPAARAAGPALRQFESASAQIGQAAQKAADATARVGAAAGQFETLARSSQPLVADLRRAADEMTRAGAAARSTLAEDSETRRRADEALAETARAAKALRELAELLEKHPSAILWGRPRKP
jgi:paraquat-inducible protein B